MPHLILIRHSGVDPRSDVPSTAWRLSPEGRARCGPLARWLAPYAPTLVVTSQEAKAAETGQRVAAALGLPLRQAADLHEHRRTHVGLLEPAAFRATMARFFTHPDQRVFGDETADQAHRRFAGAVSGLLAAHPGETLALVAHGTVITLFVTRMVGGDPFAFWQALGLPAFVALTLPR